MLCTIDAVWLGTEGGSDGVAYPGLPVLADLYREFVENGGVLYASDWRRDCIVLAFPEFRDRQLEGAGLGARAIRNRTMALSQQLAEGERLRRAALAARTELAHSRDQLAQRQQRFAALQDKAYQRALASSGGMKPSHARAFSRRGGPLK